MKYVLAPLADFTDAPFRLMCQEGGADLTYTEMVSAAALFHGHRATLRMLERLPQERNVACQLFGANEDELAFAASRITGFEELNLNAGCPMTKVTRSGAGAKLVEDPEKVYRLLKAMVDHTSIPVTLKTRLGPYPSRTTLFELADAAERAGAKGLIVHARYTSQMHGGTVHLDTLAELVSRTHLPVTGNGSVTDRKTAAAMAATGVSAIMVGRAAMANPFIFSRLADDDRAAAVPSIALCRRHLQYLLDFRDRLAAKFPDDHVPSRDGFASVKMHTHLFRYFNGRPGAAALRARLNQVRTLAEIEQIIAEFERADGLVVAQ